MNWMESQIETRQRLDAKMVERAYADLATSVVRLAPGTLAGSDREVTDAADAGRLAQADAAIAACMHACGAEPAEVGVEATDLSERIEQACQATGVMVRQVVLEPGWHKHGVGALLGILNDGTPVAVLADRGFSYRYEDPVTGTSIRAGSAESQLSGEAYMFYRPFPQHKLGLKDLIGYIKELFGARDIALILGAYGAATLVGFLPAWTSKLAFGTVVPAEDVGLIAPLGMMLVGVALSRALFGAVSQLVLQSVSIKLSVSVEAAAFARVLSLPSAFFREYPAGDVAWRLMAFSQAMTGMGQVATLVVTAVVSMLYLIPIGAYAPSLLLPAVGIAFLQGLLSVASVLAALRFDRAATAANTKLSGLVASLLQGIAKIKMAGAEDRAFSKWASGYSEYARAMYRDRTLLVICLPSIVQTVGLLGTVLLFFYAARSNLAVADYMAFSVAFGQISAAILGMASAIGAIARLQPLLEQAQPILEAVPETSEAKPAVGRVSGSVEMAHVSFRYSPSGPWIVDDLSLKIRRGEYVALVGASGSGKSTILRLLLGFEQPERGSILYDGHDLAKVDARSLRRGSVGTVMQDARLFMGDLYSNITVSTPSATIDDAWEAADLAGIGDDIRAMPMGMHTLVTEGGGGISGGQRQRIMIARAICGKRAILMLDEATSALDNITQKKVSDSLATLKCTRIVVAHRLSTVTDCDRILMLEQGKIVEEGTYDDLIARGGAFAELVERQRLDVE